MFQRLLASSLLLALVSTVVPACSVAPAGPTVTVDSATSSGADATGETVADTVPDAVAKDPFLQAAIDSCKAVCQLNASANCPDGPSLAECAAECTIVPFADILQAGCASALADFFACELSAKAVCGPGGAKFQMACEPMVAALQACATKAGLFCEFKCSKETSGGVQQCGCEAKCAGTKQKSVYVCNGKTCTCHYGKFPPEGGEPMPQGSNCDGVEAAMTAACLNVP